MSPSQRTSEMDSTFVTANFQRKNFNNWIQVLKLKERISHLSGLNLFVLKIVTGTVCMLEQYACMQGAC